MIAEEGVWGLFISAKSSLLLSDSCGVMKKAALDSNFALNLKSVTGCCVQVAQKVSISYLCKKFLKRKKSTFFN